MVSRETIIQKLRPLGEPMTRISSVFAASSLMTSELLMMPTSTSPARMAVMMVGVPLTFGSRRRGLRG